MYLNVICRVQCLLYADIGVCMCVVYMQGVHVRVRESAHLARVLVGECYQHQKEVSVGGHSPERRCVCGGVIVSHQLIEGSLNLEENTSESLFWYSFHVGWLTFVDSGGSQLIQNSANRN